MKGEKMKMNNNLIKMQEMLMRQMERLDDLDQTIGVDKGEEISRANALSQNAETFLKSVNVGLRIIEVAKKYETKKEQLTLELGVESEK